MVSSTRATLDRYFTLTVCRSSGQSIPVPRFGCYKVTECGRGRLLALLVYRNRAPASTEAHRWQSSRSCCCPCQRNPSPLQQASVLVRSAHEMSFAPQRAILNWALDTCKNLTTCCIRYLLAETAGLHRFPINEAAPWP